MKVGILGAGQLCRMLIIAGIPLGLEFFVYAPKGEHCVDQLGHLTFGEWDDEQALTAFAKQCDVITLESENIPMSTVHTLLKHTQVRPSIMALAHSQDRLKEKQLFTQLDIPNVEYAQIDELSQLTAFIEQHHYPVVLKKRCMGYDGKGQWRLHNAGDLNKLNQDQLRDCIVEKMVDFSREVSILGVRSSANNFAFYDLCENTHHQGILHTTKNCSHDPLFNRAQSYMIRLLEHLDYIGCCALELFEVNGQLIANEMAPRVHNSGHWTIEGSACSQFENHLRAIADFSLGDTASHEAYQMINILGTFPNTQQLLKYPVKVHSYGKSYKPGRKRGHLTFRQSDLSHEAVGKLYEVCVTESTQTSPTTVEI